MNLLKIKLKRKKIKSCKILNFHNGFSPFFLPILYDKKYLNLSIFKFSDALIKEGIPLGQNYGCLVTLWKWAEKYLKKSIYPKCNKNKK